MKTHELTETIDSLLSAHGPTAPLARVMNTHVRDVLAVAMHSLPEGTSARALVGKLEDAVAVPVVDWIRDIVPVDDASAVCVFRAEQRFPGAANQEGASCPMGDEAELFWLNCCEMFPQTPES